MTTEFTVGTKKTELSTAQIKRLNEIATEVIDDFEERMHDVILDNDKKIGKLIEAAEKDGSEEEVEKAKAEGQKIADQTVTSITKTANNLEVLLEQKIEAAFKQEKLLKEIDTEFKIKVAYNIAKGTISLAKNVARLVGECRCRRDRLDERTRH